MLFSWHVFDKSGGVNETSVRSNASDLFADRTARLGIFLWHALVIKEVTGFSRSVDNHKYER